MMTPPLDTEIRLLAARRLVVPEREDLHRRFRDHEQRSLFWLGVECVLILLGLGWWLSSERLLPDWQWALLFGFGFLGLFDFVLEQWASRRKLLEVVRPESKLGVHTRDSLLAAVARVKERLGLDRYPVKVYLAKEKEVNAFAMRMELLPGWRLFNSVQLNLSILHLLDEKELESVIGHELGHVFPYSPISGRCMLIHGLFAGVLSLVIAQFLQSYDWYLGAPLLALMVVRRFSQSSWVSQIRTIEFLCDDYGARAAGLLPAMTTELKLGMEREARNELLLRVLEAKLKHSRVPISEFIASYEESLPFGGVESEQAKKQLEAGIQRRLQEESTSSLKGFYQFIFKSDDADEDSLRESIEVIKKVRQVAKVPFSILDAVKEPGRWMEPCIKAIEGHPDRVLMHLEDEVDDRASTHPNVSRRLLYLWKNRDAIASA